MNALLNGSRSWPSKDKVNGTVVEIPAHFYTELTLTNLDSGDIELYNVETSEFEKWKMEKADYAKMRSGEKSKVLDFQTKTAYGRLKIVGVSETDALVTLSLAQE